MRRFNTVKKIGICCLLLFLLSCSWNISNKTLAIFFDGVPQPSEKSEKAQPARQHRQTLQLLTVTPAQRSVEQKPKSIHKVYAQKVCSKCHEVDHSNRLRQRQPELCYQCHIPFEKTYQKLHGPVAAGFCNACHEVHQSDHISLLIMPVRQICQHCHQAGDVQKNEAHKRLSKVTCLECHNAHGGESAHLLRKQERHE